VLYGNRAPVARDAPAPQGGDDWMFEAVFDYGEHDEASPTPAEVGLPRVRGHQDYAAVLS
jgi:hypothetical protein